MKRGLIAATSVAALLVSVAACGSDKGDEDSGSGDSKGKTLTVWFMDGSNPPGWTKSVQAEFEQKTGAKLDIQIQKWDGIQQKLTTALSESTPPDVFELGNTQTPSYAETGGLAELGDLKKEIGKDWTESLNKPAVFDGTQYAAPWYAANRVVIYNKKIWADAGIKDVPKTRAEFFKDLEAIQKKGDAEPLYLPGQNWYFFAGLTVGTGAELVKKDGDKFVSNLADPKVTKAMEIYQQYQAFSKAPKDKDEATPQQADVFAKGKTGAFIGMGWEAATAVKANPQIEKDLGYFTIPGESAGKPEGVFLGGSNLAIAERSKKKELAEEFLKIALSDKNEGALAKEVGSIPNKDALLASLKGNAAAEAAAPAAKGGGTTPLIPEWAAVENAPNPIKAYMTAVLNGKSPEDAAQQVEGDINKRLSQKQ
ncbi:extracellular solute-binding protein [Streptomyces sp. AV19]|uniref:extracellular solute-binding protein n=1 Tax=Streptomyces sp. AV19 TaxID=2793068 RepID=UPI0018FE3AD4|nr:extracellular solute-binding protein [Streptomyces sp. AV19]MBH1935778.1 extracellular solute-binding protein [Streptomyces sp. AV19]MDG4535948.1 extracellular solute-binding protein [Streptomyces sp. AV19]